MTPGSPNGAVAVEPDKQAAALWIRLAKCYGMILREIRRAEVDSELTLPQFDMLAQLLRHEGGLTVSELSEALLVTAGNVTGIADRLEARGLVARTVSREDGRVRILTLTAAGRRLARRAVGRHERALCALLEDVPLREQRQLASGLETLRQTLLRKCEESP